MQTVISPQPPRPYFGCLPKDIHAREKRTRMKFFDSAEWAMKEESESVKLSKDKKAESAPLPVPTTDEIKKYIEHTKCFERSPLEV